MTRAPRQPRSGGAPATRWRCDAAFVVRAPALPAEVFEALSRWQAGDAPSLDGAPLGALLRDPYIMLALAVASPALAEALRRHRAGDARPERLVRPLLAYLTRMSTRATPFGLFAGIARGGWGDRADVDLVGRPSLARARPDMEWLYGLVQGLERDPAVRPGLTLRTHPTVRIRGGRAAVVGHDAQGDATSAAATSVRATPVVREALDLCREGAPRADVERRLCDGTGRDPAKTERLLNSLCDHGFLITSLRPALTAAPAREVARALEATGGDASGTASALEDLVRRLDAWAPSSDDGALRQWESLTGAAAALDARTPAIQVDVGFERDVRLPVSVAREAGRAADLLFRLSAWPLGPPPLDRWRPEFAARYGQGRPVPVLDLLDRGLPAIDAGGAGHRDRDRVLLEIAGEALRRGETVVELDDARIGELEQAGGRPARAPRSVDLFCALACAGERDLDEGRFLLVVDGASSPAGRSYGRFGHLFAPDDPGRAADPPSAGDTVVAELHFEPLVPRSGNVMIRTPLASHAIHLGGGLPGAGTPVIPLDELAVTLDGTRLRLLWTREGVYVAATYCHLLSQRLAPALARFLYEVSRDGETVVDRFSWGAARHLPALPRLQAGRVVLRRAEWSVDRAFLDRHEQDRAAAVQEAGLPRHVLIGGPAEPLLVDLESDCGAALLRAAARRTGPDGRLRVTEALPAPEHALARGRDGHRPIELVVPVHATRVAPAHGTRTPPARPRVAADPRCWPPGSEWLYAKLYLAPDLADELIGGPLRALARELTDARHVGSWFFLRFADPDFHVRLRLRGDPATLMTSVLPRLCEWARRLVDQRTLERFALDTYEPEVERYGGPAGVLLAERAFAADSAAVAELVARREAILGELDWARLGAWTVDDLLDALGLRRDERARWYRERYAIYEHSAEFRGARAPLRALLDGDGDGDDAPRGGPARDAVAAILDQRRAALRDVAHGFDALAHDGRLSMPLADVAASLVHMHCNRLGATTTEAESRIVGLAGLTAASLAAWPSSPRPLV